MGQIVKILLTGTLLLCFLSMPMMFYKVSNYFLFVGFGWLAYDAFQREDHLDVKIYALLTIIYNPFFVIPLPHSIWIIINIIVIIGLILNILFAEDDPFEDFTKKDDR